MLAARCATAKGAEDDDSDHPQLYGLAQDDDGYTTRDSEPISEHEKEKEKNKGHAPRASGKRRLDFGDESRGICYQDSTDGLLRPRIVVPRILRDDIRRRYCEMFANVYNACDWGLTCAYLSKFYRPDYSIVQELFGSFPIGLKGRCEMYGLSVIGRYWYERMTDMADLVMRVQDTEIRIASDHSGVVSVKFTISGHLLLPVAEPVVRPTSCKVDARGRTVMVFGEDAASDEVRAQIESVPAPAFRPEELPSLHFDVDHPSLGEAAAGEWRDCVAFEPRTRTRALAAAATAPTACPATTSASATQVHTLTAAAAPVLPAALGSQVRAGLPPAGDKWISIEPAADTPLASVFTSNDAVIHLHFDADSLIHFGELYFYAS